jgi:ABC-type phosphate/phosphonate transport system permease subunit
MATISVFAAILAIVLGLLLANGIAKPLRVMVKLSEKWLIDSCFDEREPLLGFCELFP